jgi:hypothetical protein
VAVTTLLEWSRNELLTIVNQLPTRATEAASGSPREKV